MELSGDVQIAGPRDTQNSKESPFPCGKADKALHDLASLTLYLTLHHIVTQPLRMKLHLSYLQMYSQSLKECLK